MSLFGIIRSQWVKSVKTYFANKEFYKNKENAISTIIFVEVNGGIWDLFSILVS